MRVRQKYPYYEWEDYQAGMFGMEWEGTATDARELLASPERLHAAMMRAVSEWPKAAAHHLTDDGMNQQAWLGWAACGLHAKVPAHLTRAAWWTLTDDERNRANAIADAVIEAYHRAETLPFD